MAFVSAAIKPSTEHLHPRGVMFVHERPLEVETGIEMTVCLLFFVVCIFPSLYTLVWYPIQSKYVLLILILTRTIETKYRSHHTTINAIDFWINLLTSTTHMLHTDLRHKCLVGHSQLVLISRLFY